MNTILEVQPRVSLEGGVERGDEIVDSLASSILKKIEHFNFDLEKAEHKLFKKDKKGRWEAVSCE